MIYLINPAKRGRKKMARKRRKLSAKARAAALRNLAKARRARGGSTKRRRRRKAAVSTTTRRRKRTVASRRRRSGAKRRRKGISFTRLGGRIYRRNPGVKGIVSIVKEGVIGAVGVKAGSAATKMVSSTVARFLPSAAAGVTALGVSAAAGIVVGYAGKRFVPKYATPLLYGAFMPLVDALIVQYAPAQVQSLLAGDIDVFDGFAAYPRMASYPAMASYPQGLAGVGDDAMLVGTSDYGF